MMDYGDEHHERPTVIRCHTCQRERPENGDGTMWYMALTRDDQAVVLQCGPCTLSAALALDRVTRDTIDARFYSFMN